MIDFSVTKSGEVDLAELAREVKRFPDRVADVVEAAVEAERSTHRYQNRTGDAEASTQAITIGSGDSSATIGQMNVPYAGYLQGKWSRFETLMQRAEKRIAAIASKLER